MRKLVKIELEKALKNKIFFMMILLGCFCAFFSFLYRYSAWMDARKQIEIVSKLSKTPYDPEVQAYIFSNSWIGGEDYSLGFAVFYFLFPVMTVFPYAWSYVQEKKTGYLRLVAVISEKRRYYKAKYIAIFLCGGLVMAIPLFFSAVLTSAFIPNLIPDSLSLYSSMSQNSMWSWIFYRNPSIFVCMYIALDFLFGGLIAVAAYGISFFVPYEIPAMISPFLVFLLFRQYAKSTIMTYEISPFYFLHAMPIVSLANGYIISAFAFVLFAVSALGMWKGSCDEIL